MFKCKCGQRANSMGYCSNCGTTVHSSEESISESYLKGKAESTVDTIQHNTINPYEHFIKDEFPAPLIFEGKHIDPKKRFWEPNNKNLKIRKYACPICKKRLKSTKALLDHGKQVHGKTSVVFSCKICKKPFATEQGLTAHTKHVHENTINSLTKHQNEEET